ncbi:hypothetical protein [Tropicibacter naphthalenivorans]|uniref:Uncharacterized protein n=1 Tax=Tropicibacter naphthalenivorans TaxID=441103 RepID=A0A0P1GGA3_9RHOB|nr:hypothetical protein [Tropicibacter naphthalenivorans]CUH80588.1 hypothetical protein TRN7648_03042 [Tropicibacter naphthalenivorans]SMC88923.1 hypothetical protein SAMN04488093_10613 [Tropicibacter naphthalenivorans]
MPHSAPRAPSDVNAALFCDFADAGFLDAALQGFVHSLGPVLLTDDAALLPRIAPPRRVAIAGLGLDRVPIESSEVLGNLWGELASF